MSILKKCFALAVITIMFASCMGLHPASHHSNVGRYRGNVHHSPGF